MYMNFIACAFVFSFGSDFRRIVFRNWLLTLNFVSLYVVTALLFLLPPCGYTSWWHIASYAYNSNDTNNPVWKEWQEQGMYKEREREKERERRREREGEREKEKKREREREERKRERLVVAEGVCSCVGGA